MTLDKKLLEIASIRLETELQNYAKNGLQIYGDFTEKLEKICEKYGNDETEIITLCELYFKSNKREFEIAYWSGFKDCHKINKLLNSK